MTDSVTATAWVSGWRCFHCEEVFTDRQRAADHFGVDPAFDAACVQVLAEGERAIVEDRREWRDRALRAEAENEGLEHRLGAMESEIARRWKGARSLAEVWHRFESMEGELLAARAQNQAPERAFRAGYDAAREDARRHRDGDEPHGVTHWWALEAERASAPAPGGAGTESAPREDSGAPGTARHPGVSSAAFGDAETPTEPKSPAAGEGIA